MHKVRWNSSNSGPMGVKARVDDALLKYVHANPDVVSMDKPKTVMDIPPLAISDAATGASLSAFREVMNYENLQSSFRHTGQYEAAGTIWMLDPCGHSVSDESVTVGQIEAARWQWSEDAFLQSSMDPDMRRFSFDVPLPARMPKTEMAQRKAPTSPGVVMSAPVPMIAGKAHVLAWYSAVSDALQDADANHKRVVRLFEAALSVPIRLRLCPDDDACALASLQYAEAAGMHAAASGADSFWVFTERVARLSAMKHMTKENVSAPRMAAKLRSLGVTFKGKKLDRWPCQGIETTRSLRLRSRVQASVFARRGPVPGDQGDDDADAYGTTVYQEGSRDQPLSHWRAGQFLYGISSRQLPSGPTHR